MTISSTAFILRDLQDLDDKLDLLMTRSSGLDQTRASSGTAHLSCATASSSRYRVELGDAQMTHFRGTALTEKAFDHVQQNQARIRFLRKGQARSRVLVSMRQKNPAGTESSCITTGPVA